MSSIHQGPRPLSEGDNQALALDRTTTTRLQSIAYIIVVLCVGWFAGPTHAMQPLDNPNNVQQPGEWSIERLARQLVGSDRSERIFALNELSRLTRISLRQAQGREGRITTDEANSTLAALDELAVPSCELGLDFPELTAGCARILGMLESSPSLPHLQRRQTTETRPRQLKEIEKAIQRITAAQTASDGAHP
jgi:hypothetical protein